MGAVMIGALGCATSPTGRGQLILLPESQMAQMGAQAFQEMKATQPTERDPRYNEYVACIARPLIQVSESGIPADKWEIVVFREPSANAFALPGGKIGVHTGLLNVAKTEAQLAAVIGHEIGHVLARHGNERVSQGVVAQGGQVALGVMLKDQAQRGTLLALLGVGVQVGVLLPYGRTQESEADHIGVRMMARAGFDPAESIELWKNMSTAGGAQPPQFLSTHPSHKTRIGDLQALQPEMTVLFEKAKATGRKPECKRPQ